MRRSGFPALGQPRRRAGAHRVPRRWSCSTSSAAFQALGTLLAVGLMMLPAVTARFWTRDITAMIVVAVAHRHRCRAMSACCCRSMPALPAGPAIILVAGALYVGSVLVGPRRRHAAAARSAAGILKHDAVARVRRWSRDGGRARVCRKARSTSRRFTILADFARNVGGDRVEVVSLVGPNGDAHSYVPSPADARSSPTQARDPQWAWPRRVDRALSRAAANERAGHRRQRRRHPSCGSAMPPDPHAWQSVANAKIYVANIRDALIAVDPADKATFEANAAAYLSQARCARRRGHGGDRANSAGPPQARHHS